MRHKPLKEQCIAASKHNQLNLLNEGFRHLINNLLKRILSKNKHKSTHKKKKKQYYTQNI